MFDGSYIATSVEAPSGEDWCWYEFEPAWRPESIWFGPVLLEFEKPPFHGLEGAVIKAYADYEFGRGVIFTGGPELYLCFSDLIGPHDTINPFIDPDAIYTIELA